MDRFFVKINDGVLKNEMLFCYWSLTKFRHIYDEKLLQNNELVFERVAFDIQYSIFLEKTGKMIYNKIDRYLYGGFHGKEIDKI